MPLPNQRTVARDILIGIISKSYLPYVIATTSEPSPQAQGKSSGRHPFVVGHSKAHSLEV
jgi:hypothetical protein